MLAFLLVTSKGINLFMYKDTYYSASGSGFTISYLLFTAGIYFLGYFYYVLPTWPFAGGISLMKQLPLYFILESFLSF